MRALCVRIITLAPFFALGFTVHNPLSTGLFVGRTPIRWRSQSENKLSPHATARSKDEFDGAVYSRDLIEKVRQERDDEYKVVDQRSYPWWKRLFRRGLRRAKQPGRLILLRNGESTWNVNGTFIGWADPDLSPQGKEECEYAARLMVAEGYEPDLVYTSRLKRGIQSALIVLEQTQGLFLPIYKSWRLNERSYGALTGISKKETAKKFGTAVVQAWRNSLKAKPPPLSKDDVFFPGNDPRYADLSEEDIPLSESLRECFVRTRPLWESKIRNDLARGDTVMVVGHSNSLRGLIQVIDEVDDDSILQVNIPPGIPLVYRFDANMRPMAPQRNKPTQMFTSASFLEKPEKIQAALQKHKEWKATVPGLESVAVDGFEENAVASRIRRKESLEDSLARLKKEEGLLPEVLQSLIPEERWEDDPCVFEESDEEGLRVKEENKSVMMNIEPLPSDSVNPVLNTDPVVVFIRHGRTPHNNLALFTGWEDPPLATEGVQDAKRAGQILKRHGYQFDVVYTSWLTRAIQTAFYVLDEMNCVWVPMVKSWRLNERMYGALTGKSKAMIANQYGEDQLKRWRRGFKIRPPPVSSYSLSYPGNDYRRTKYVKDLRISWSETLNRSLERGKLEIHRKFPKTESLHDCMQRSIPFYSRRIVTEAVSKGKRVLITGHENSIRGILMYLCDIPVEAMSQLHIPNGMPLVYSVRGKCIKVLDDGSGRDPMDIHDFGPAAPYLFKPCQLDDDFFEKMAAEADGKGVTKVKSTTPTSKSMDEIPEVKEVLEQPVKRRSSKAAERSSTKADESWKDNPLNGKMAVTMDVEQLTENIFAEVEQCADHLPIEMEQPTGNLPVEIEQRTAIKQSRDNLPTEMEQPKDNLPTEMEQLSDQLLAEMEQPIDHLPTEMEQAATEMEQPIDHLSTETEQPTIGQPVDSKSLNEAPKATTGIEKPTNNLKAEVDRPLED